MSEDPTSEASEPQNTPAYIERVNRLDLDSLLTERLGSGWRDYRLAYERSLLYHQHLEVPPFPLTLGVELVNRCNLNCVMCVTSHHKGSLYSLSIDGIDRLLQECAKHNMPAVIIGTTSEVLLHKDVAVALACAKKHGLLDIWLMTNGILLNETISEYLVANQITRVVVSLDAARPETYKAIRGKDLLATVEWNIRRLIEVRKRSNSVLPIIRVSFCVQPQNVDECQEFADKWRDVVEYIDFQTLFDFTPFEQLKAGKPVQDKPFSDTICPLPFNSLQVLANGDVLPCCTYYGELMPLGNLREATLKEMWDGKAMNEIRQGLLSGNPMPTCRVCLGHRGQNEFKTAAKALRGSSSSLKATK
jgi:radical SAM protein with 4Fe4S-binding SPASM domain